MHSGEQLLAKLMKDAIDVQIRQAELRERPALTIPLAASRLRVGDTPAPWTTTPPIFIELLAASRI
jgi:hypothetical protein